jgi:hypothetical protein
MANNYDIGDRVKIYTTFQDEDGVAVDPDVVKFVVKTPADVETTYTYDVEADVQKEATGDYWMLVNADESGEYKYRIFGETSGGDNMGADEGRFKVRASTL